MGSQMTMPGLVVVVVVAVGRAGLVVVVVVAVGGAGGANDEEAKSKISITRTHSNNQHV
jgi:hypothetical protein